MQALILAGGKGTRLQTSDGLYAETCRSIVESSVFALSNRDFAESKNQRHYAFTKLSAG